MNIYIYAKRIKTNKPIMLFELQTQLDQMRAKLEKSEKERNDYKQISDRLEMKVSSLLHTAC